MSNFFTAPASQRKRKTLNHDKSSRPTKRRAVEGRRRGDQTIKSAGPVRERVSTIRRTQKQAEIDNDDDDDSVSSRGSGTEDEIGTAGEESDVTSEEDETAAERRIRLAQRYLERIKDEVDEAGFDAEDLDRDIIARRLKEDNDEVRGRQFRLIATSLDLAHTTHTNFRADTLSTTAVASCKPFVYTVSKDRTLIKWQIPAPQSTIDSTKRRGHDGVTRRPKQLAFVKGVKIRASAKQQHGHTAAILSVAASPDGQYVATGGADKKLIIWAAEDLRPLKTFYTHRDAVTGLDFAPASAISGLGMQLFSAGADRSIKTYSLAGENSLAYVETLFGHQDHVLGVSAVAQDLCVTVGARDRSARWWRVVDETQLKFLGDSARSDEYQTGSLDCVAAIPPNHFVTGSDSGAIQLWSQHKKKSLFTIATAHDVDPLPPLEEVTSEADPNIIAELKKSDRRRPTPRAITSLAVLPGTDIILSGSWDGWVRIWKVSDDKRMLHSIGKFGSITTSQKPTSTNQTNGGTEATSWDGPGPIRGVINGLTIFERRKETVNEFGGKKQGESQGLCVVAGVGKESRLGRWTKAESGRNGAIAFEIPLTALHLSENEQ